MGLGVEWAVDWLKLSAKAMAEHRVELIEMDRAIGDSDHGENMDRGFQAVVQKLEEAPPETPGAALKVAAMTLMSKVGGAAGPLYGTAYLRAATSLGDLTDVDAGAMAEALAAARDGVVARGKAEPGDKTMIDAWTPAVDAARNAAATGGPLDVLEAAAQAAEAGATATDPLVARKGRASYLGERSAGHRDPGAASSALILRAAVDAASSPGSAGTGPE
ncbi:dihydroxyacetone kinase subunit DhaL [Arthrobacter sp. fls2-241-R2A-200]|uniref:dihydroxyacetone kinase subunit DhaL n=1 Tax=Arthrobacter sp. fls2-241-R2A-200 TaxID=3040281 RepID=UPI00254E35CA|nr:dihydroxyacetone kinase subunit DhaL [Arthrobacter sp. fls2-241-R2A-200]